MIFQNMNFLEGTMIFAGTLSLLGLIIATVLHLRAPKP